MAFGDEVPAVAAMTPTLAAATAAIASRNRIGRFLAAPLVVDRVVRPRGPAGSFPSIRRT
jgi:hypothetical protein